MSVRLTTGELRVLAELEASLRTSDPWLDRRLGRRRNTGSRLLWRPVPLVVLITVLATATAASLVSAVAWGILAAAPAGPGVVGLTMAFRRLAQLGR